MSSFQGEGLGMRIVPVIDLLGGQVVQAVGGERDRYRPIASGLGCAPLPRDVGNCFAKAFGPRTLYVADLDALAGGEPDWASLCQLTDTGHRLLLDCGVGSPARAEAVQTEAAARGVDVQFVVALESLGSPEQLGPTCRAFPRARAVFSLDLYAGRIWNADPDWQSLQPAAAVELAVTHGIAQVIVLDLAAVGRATGPVIGELCRSLRAAHPRLRLLGGGGIRGLEDLHQLAACGCDDVLVASALHDGRLDPATVRACESGSGGRL
jgi:phosphoribosylformimino-5-aminoimidazole carboxamide ribotide isomerase